MKRLYRSAKKLWTTFFTLWHHFGFCVAWYQTIDIITYHFPNTKLDTYVKQHMHESIKRYLKKHYGDVIEQFKTRQGDTSEQDPQTKIIWQCWWQGEEYLEGITRACVNSVAEHANGHDVVIITENNFNQYVEIPPFILGKVKDKTIPITFFSDYLRMNLLYQNGGLWIDATALVTQNIPSYCFSNQGGVYSTRSEAINNTFASEYRWSSWTIGGDKKNLLFEFFCQMVETYWTHETNLINYYLVDYIIALGYDNIPAIKEIIDAIPYTNPRKHDLCELLNTSYNHAKEDLDAICADTCIHKLSRKIELHDTTAQGEYTVYRMIKERYSSKK